MAVWKSLPGHTLPAETCIGYFAPPGQFQWRFPLAVQLIPCSILFLGAFFLPESPRWVGRIRVF